MKSKMKKSIWVLSILFIASCFVFNLAELTLSYAQEAGIIGMEETDIRTEDAVTEEIIADFGNTADETSVLEQEVEENQPKDIFDLVVPGSIGRIKEQYKGSTDKVIIYIQDAHLNYEAQTNIMNILDMMVEDYGLSVAGIEGAGGVIETDYFASFPEDEIRGQAADIFMRDGHLSGPENLVINKGMEYPLRLFGIEDIPLYKENLKSFQDSLPFKNEALGFFRRLNIALAQLKTELYTQEIRDVDTQRLSYDLRLTSLNNYVEFLKSNMDGNGISDMKYPNFSKLVSAIEIEETLDFIQAEDERTKLLTELTNVLSEDDIRGLLDKGLAYKNEQISASNYLSFVKELALGNKIDFNKYKSLDKYINYAKNYDEIKSFELFNEIEDADAAIREKLYKNNAQKKLDLLLRGLRVMERLVEIKMVNKDLAFYNTYSDELKTDAYLKFIEEQANKLGINVNLPADISYLDVYIPAWVDFYKVAGLRDEAMLNNSLRILKEHNQNNIAIVTGGFHTREMTKLMRERGISHIVITPRITQNIPGPYFDRLTGKKSALEGLMGEINSSISVKSPN